MERRPLMRSERFVRAMDLVLATSALVFFAPVCLLIALIVKLQDGGPVIFAQERIGRGGKTFRCMKFRTMAPNAEAQLREVLARDPEARKEWARSQKLRRDPRITPVGRFLRESSLDELPQLLNVIRGEMSIVGPRPIVRDEVVHYGRQFKRYCSVRPGLTGLWQVSGRSDATYRERVILDVAYIRGRCLWLDLKVIARTVPAVLLRRGSY